MSLIIINKSGFGYLLGHAQINKYQINELTETASLFQPLLSHRVHVVY